MKTIRRITWTAEEWQTLNLRAAIQHEEKLSGWFESFYIAQWALPAERRKSEAALRQAFGKDKESWIRDAQAFYALCQDVAATEGIEPVPEAVPPPAPPATPMRIRAADIDGLEAMLRRLIREELATAMRQLEPLPPLPSKEPVAKRESLLLVGFPSAVRVVLDATFGTRYRMSWFDSDDNPWQLAASAKHKDWVILNTAMVSHKFFYTLKSTLQGERSGHLIPVHSGLSVSMAADVLNGLPTRAALMKLSSDSFTIPRKQTDEH